MPDAAADETVLDTQSIPIPVVSVRQHHSFAQIIIRWNFVCGIKILLRPTQKYLVHGAARGSHKALQKMPNTDCDVREKVDIPKRQDDDMHLFLHTSSSAILESSIPSMAHHRSTARSGCEWRLWSSQVWKWRIVCTSQICSRVFFSKVADAAREHQTHHQPTEKWNVVCGPGRFSELGCVDLGVVRTRASVTRADVSANGTQAGRDSVFSSRTLTHNSLQSPISKVLGRTQSRGQSPRNNSCRALSHLQARDPKMAPCQCITCVLSVL